MKIQSMTAADNECVCKEREYRIKDLGTLGGTESAGFALNSKGVVVTGERAGYATTRLAVREVSAIASPG
jgi:hypothetical protein